MEQTFRILVKGEPYRDLRVEVWERDDLEYDKVASSPIPGRPEDDFHGALAGALGALGQRLVRLDPVFVGMSPAKAIEFVAHTVELGSPDNCPTCGFPRSGIPLHTDEQPPEREKRNPSLVDRHMTP